MSGNVESETPYASEPDRAAVLQTVADYQTSFSAHDPHGAQLFYHEPCTFIFADRVVLLASRPDIEAFFTSVIRGLEARGWRHSEWSEIYFKQMNDGLSLVSTVAIRYRTDGQELERIGATYTFRKTEHGWKIAAAVTHPPDTVIRFHALQ